MMEMRLRDAEFAGRRILVATPTRYALLLRFSTRTNYTPMKGHAACHGTAPSSAVGSYAHSLLATTGGAVALIQRTSVLSSCSYATLVNGSQLPIRLRYKVLSTTSKFTRFAARHLHPCSCIRSALVRSLSMTLKEPV